ncbi:MAG: YfhO family protein [Candidatus Cloacimonas sp.]|nr:YfhO family protein [Candidatus Cloacimonas sp.]
MAKNVNLKMKPDKPAPPKHGTADHSANAKQYANISRTASSDSSFGKHLPWVLVVILFLALSLIYFPVAYQGKAPQALDITQWQGGAKAIIDYNAANKDQALWTPAMFSGMPSYMISFPNRYPFLESLTKLTDKIINWRIFLLFIGGFGFFMLIRHLKLSPWIAFFAAVSFVFTCHWLGLIEIGHNTKFRAIMYIPWVLWALLRLKEKPNLLNLGLLATFFITQLRENHPQVTYYLYLFIGMFWVYGLIEALQEKKLKGFSAWTLLLVAAFGLTVLAVMNPYLSTLDYSHYTMRGGATGLEKSYAQAWSFPPVEMIALIIPNFFGGINQFYWGYMNSTQIYNYFGIVILALGVFGLFGKHRKLSIFLWITSFVFMLMSFGSFTPALSDIFLKLLPYFNKFRVPSMILIMVQINAVLLAALGMDSIVAAEGNKIWEKRLFKVFWISGVVFLVYLVAAKTFFKGLPFTNPAEIQYYTANNALSQLQELKPLRLEMLVKSGILSLLFLTIGMGLAYLFSAKKLKAPVFIMLITVLCFVDVFIYTGKYLKDLYPASERTARFEMQDYDQFLLQNTDNHRIFPFNMNRPAGEWAYYHQTIDGYSAAKLKRYDDILKLVKGDGKVDGELVRYLKGVYQSGGKETPTPVLDMLSTKYFIYPDSLPYANLLQKIKPVFSSYSGANIYQNLSALPRAWFVDSLVVQPDAGKLLETMKNPAFSPRTLALVESAIPDVQKPDSSFVKQTASAMHDLKYDVYTDKNAFIVLSEVYYPAGWKAYLDGKETTIYPTNHVLRGIAVPAGKHALELRFVPDTYATSLRLSLSGLLLTLLAVVGGFILQRRKKVAGVS